MASAHSVIPELARLFLWLGATAFGGPAAHVALMRDEVVRRRAWLSDAEFLDLVGAAQLIPGPNSTELAIHIGRRLAGARGLLVSGACFIAPAFFMTMLFGFVYVEFGALPSARGLMLGVKPVIVAIVAHALWTLFPSAARTNFLRALFAVTILSCALGVHELAVLLGAGLVHMAKTVSTGRAEPPRTMWITLSGSGALATTTLAHAPTLPSLFWVFAKIGSVLFGSGYVLIAFLRGDLVERLHWLSEAQLLDAVAIGQVTPGPVFTTATFIGYLLAGPSGAIVATLGIFLPAFGFVAASAPLLPRLRASRSAAAFLDGVNAASLALMAVAALEISRAAFVDLPTILTGLASFVVLVRFRINATWLVLGGAVIGLCEHALFG